jgi:GT2 family glycosyltransferase
LRPLPRRDLADVEALTAACLVMRTDEARGLGGFDERFLIGDFEDADLCRRLAEAGLGCAVDHALQLHHLERRSQSDSSHVWRRNLTLYNAWQHQRRWFGAG